MEKCNVSILTVKKVTKKFTLDMTDFFEQSRVPMTVRIKLRLSELGMKFADDGKLSFILDREPKPLGIVECWTDPEFPTYKYYRQRTLEIVDDEIA